MKKLFCILTAAAMAASLAACGSTAATEASGAVSEAASEASEAMSEAADAASEVADAASEAAEEVAGAIATVEDLEGKTIGVQLGTTGDLDVTDMFGEDAVERFNKAGDAVQALLSDKVDAVIIDDQVAKNFVEQNADTLQVLETPFETEAYAICLNKGSELTEQFNAAYDELEAEGVVAAIYDKYITGTEGAEGYTTPEGTEYPNGTLVMATNAAFEPFEYIEGGEVVGYDAEMAKAICDKLGYELQIEDMEFESIIPAVTSGKADFGCAGMTDTEERRQNVDFTESYFEAQQAIVVRK